jgi:hypothetical protein
MATLLTNAELLERFDYRLIDQQLSDNNTVIGSAALASSTQLSEIITDAEGLVLSALYTAYKYTSDNMTNLDSDSAHVLKRIIADIAFIYICSRRGYDYKNKMPLVEDSYKQLQRLRNGERVLNFPSNLEAGNTFNESVSFVNQAIAGLVTTSTRYFPLPTYTQNRF